MAKSIVTKIALDQQKAEVLQNWRNVQAAAKQYKDAEHQFRTYIETTFGFNPSKLEGTQWIEFNNGTKLKLVRKQSYTGINTEAGKETTALIDAVWEVTQDAELCQGLVKWVPDYSSKYLKRLYEVLQTLPDEQQARINKLLSAAVSVKPGLPDLSFVEAGSDETKT